LNSIVLHVLLTGAKIILGWTTHGLEIFQPHLQPTKDINTTNNKNEIRPQFYAMEFMTNLQSGLDVLKPSLFGRIRPDPTRREFD
jgi:hypothetical protein